MYRAEGVLHTVLFLGLGWLYCVAVRNNHMIPAGVSAVTLHIKGNVIINNTDAK